MSGLAVALGLLVALGATGCGSSKPQHDDLLVSVEATPARQLLSETTENAVTATTDLGFDVVVRNAGHSQEPRVKVTLTVEQTPTPIVLTRTIRRLDPGEQRTVRFRDLGQVMFVIPLSVKVDIQPVPQEEHTADNWAVYPVVFSLG